jgi:hypothetical protein
MTIKELKKLIEQYKQEAEAEIPKLKTYIVDGEANSASEDLGHAQGYAQALKEILSKI